MRYDFVDLNIFLSLSRTLNLTVTADEVNLTTAAVSVRLKKLEEALGVKLFERGPRGIRMTSAAMVLKPHVLSIWTALRAMEKELRSYQNPKELTLTVSTNTTGLQNVLSRACRIFLENHPVRLQIISNRSTVSAEAVIRGTVDVAFGLKKYADLYADALEIVPFMSDRLVAILPREHPLSAYKKIDYATFLQYDYLSLLEDFALTQAMSERARNRGYRYRPLMQLPSFDQLIDYVDAQIGSAIVPYSALSHYLNHCSKDGQPSFDIVPLSDSFADRTLVFMMKKDSPRLSLIEELIETCRHTIQTKPAG